MIEAMHTVCTHTEYAATGSWFRRVGLTTRTKFSALSPPYAILRVLPCRSREGMQMLLRLTLQVCVGAGAVRRALFLRAFYSVCPCAETALRVLQTRALRSRLSPKENEQRTP